MSEDPKVRETVVGLNSASEKDRRCARALRSLHAGASLMFDGIGMSQMEVLAVMAGTTAHFAEQFDEREACAEMFERWAELLRSDNPIVHTAEGNA